MTITNEISNRQLEIIEVSGKILIEKGIKGLTTKTVASEMNFSESAIYRHFKSKEEILIALLSLLKQNMNKRLTSEIKPQNTAAENFKAVFTSQFNYFKKNPHFVVAAFSDGLMEESQRINDTILKIMGTKIKYLSPIILDGQKIEVFGLRILIL